MKKRVLSLILCLSLLLGGCSGLQNSQAPTGKEGAYSAESVADGEEEVYGSADYSESYSDIEVGQSDPSSSAGEADQSDSSSSAGEADQTEIQTENTDNQKLVYTCDMTIETLEYEETIKSIKQSISKYSGITEKETQTDNNSYWYYDGGKKNGTITSYLVVRIPAANYNAFLEELNGSGKITSKDMSVENISKRYSEVETTIKSLQIQEKRLLDMMEKAKNVDDMITVESRLTEVQNELAQYKNSLASMDTDVKYSTVNISIHEVVQYEEDQETFAQRLHSTLKRSGDLFLEFLEGALFTVILLGPILLVIIAVVLVIVLIIRKIRKKRKQKKIRKTVPANAPGAHKAEKEETEDPGMEQAKTMGAETEKSEEKERITEDALTKGPKAEEVEE